MSIVAAVLHHLAFVVLGAMLTTELLLLRGELTVQRARQIVVCDLVYGVSALLLIVVGVSRVFFFEKGSTYYFHSFAFIAKISVFVIMGVLSIKPTLTFMSWRPALRRGELPSISVGSIVTARRLIHWQLVAIVFILTFAVLLAKGYWLF